jgi:hypothetical protein
LDATTAAAATANYPLAACAIEPDGEYGEVVRDIDDALLVRR